MPVGHVRKGADEVSERTPEDSGPGDVNRADVNGAKDSGKDDRTNGLRNRRRTLGWFPASSMVSSNKDYRAPGSAGGRRFLSTEHLATEAVAAYVDGELRMNAYMRASQHLEMCAQCRAEVDAQSSARAALRRSGQIAMPAGLLGALNQIPTREIDLRAAAGNPAEVTPDEPLLGAPGFPVHRRRNR
jgi:hypothetical protein